MLKEKDKKFIMEMWDLKERDFYADNRGTTIIAPNKEEEALEMSFLLGSNYEIYLHRRQGNSNFKTHTLVKIRRKKSKNVNAERVLVPC